MSIRLGIRKGEMMNDFRAFVLDLVDGQTKMEVKQLSANDLPDGDVTIRVAFSSVNFKDGLATIPNRIIKTYPLIPGIDLAGTVIESQDERFREGDPVIVTSYELGVSHHGGFSEVARVPAKWVVPLPNGLNLREAMILGTAGFTAALSVQRLEENGLQPAQGPVLVTGATGGVGSVSVDILSKIGYEVVASTGKTSEHEYLYQLGAKQVIHREEVVASEQKPLRQQRWAGAIDPVGGKTLEYVLSTIQYGGSVALSGLTGGTDVSTTVHPFILRGVNLLGIDSVYCPMKVREKVWKRLATDLKPKKLNENIVDEISLEELPEVLSKILKGQIRGRTIVKM
ncbi:putative quinone oxidoreductase YhfP [Aneurinibacillus danicus]|jgi:putative YhdH/YhfP family quinone oxidoreductase|uniref:Putative quinone oxidoreductase YhfP n=2 Tax=Aneurinibacillus danicus TaxID=267746 RepID=A0A511VC75_9BACL|nr:putative quinone oxidoreductase YhfP [Aneurinibacillus danicus]